MNVAVGGALVIALVGVAIGLDIGGTRALASKLLKPKAAESRAVFELKIRVATAAQQLVGQAYAYSDTHSEESRKQFGVEIVSACERLFKRHDVQQVLCCDSIDGWAASASDPVAYEAIVIATLLPEGAVIGRASCRIEFWSANELEQRRALLAELKPVGQP